MLQVKGSYRGQMQDEDHTDEHYITLFAEQLTRPFEVLVLFVHIFKNRDLFQELKGINSFLKEKWLRY